MSDNLKRSLWGTNRRIMPVWHASTDILTDPMAGNIAVSGTYAERSGET
jgi:hypothetical protein